MSVWEYKITSWQNDTSKPRTIEEYRAIEEKRMNELGAQGWELFEHRVVSIGTFEVIRSIWKRQG